MTAPIWFKAMQGMPRLEKEQWQHLNWFSRWLVVSRSAVLLMTFVSAALGGLLAWSHENFQIGLWLMAVLGLMLAHACNNIINDFTDSYKGIDQDNYFRTRYGVQPLESGLMSRFELFRYLAVTGGAALSIAVFIYWQRGEAVLWLTMVGAFFVLFYTWPLKYIGLGEPAVLLVWGPLMVGGTYFVCTGDWSWQASWIGFIYALAPTSVLFGKHIDKLEADKQKGVRTLPVILGERRARFTVQALLGMQYILVFFSVVLGFASWPLLMVFATLPKYLRLFNVFMREKPEMCPERYPQNVWPLWFSAYAFDHTRWVGLGIMLGVVL